MNQHMHPCPHMGSPLQVHDVNDAFPHSVHVPHHGGCESWMVVVSLPSFPVLFRKTRNSSMLYSMTNRIYLASQAAEHEAIEMQQPLQSIDSSYRKEQMELPHPCSPLLS